LPPMDGQGSYPLVLEVGIAVSTSSTRYLIIGSKQIIAVSPFVLCIESLVQYAS
jgi:hypothetical protein